VSLRCAALVRCVLLPSARSRVAALRSFAAFCCLALGLVSLRCARFAVFGRCFAAVRLAGRCGALGCDWLVSPRFAGGRTKSAQWGTRRLRCRSGLFPLFLDRSQHCCTGMTRQVRARRFAGRFVDWSIALTSRSSGFLRNFSRISLHFCANHERRRGSRRARLSAAVGQTRVVNCTPWCTVSASTLNRCARSRGRAARAEWGIQSRKSRDQDRARRANSCHAARCAFRDQAPDTARA
jgi:hypothetical protein